MTIEQYELITGITVPESRQGFVTAQIARTRRMLESMLGYTLTLAEAHDNQYVEEGRTQNECPCTYDGDTALNPADAIVTAYRLYSYNPKDKYLMIDPASEIHSVKLVSGNVTFKTLESEEYRPHKINGIIKALEQPNCWCLCRDECDGVQLAVDADWLWFTGDTIPEDLMDVWAQMTTHYADGKKDIQAETLGSHSYRKFDNARPETDSLNITIIKKYAGPNGSLKRTVTL